MKLQKLKIEQSIYNIDAISIRLNKLSSASKSCSVMSKELVIYDDPDSHSNFGHKIIIKKIVPLFLFYFVSLDISECRSRIRDMIYYFGNGLMQNKFSTRWRKLENLGIGKYIETISVESMSASLPFISYFVLLKFPISNIRKCNEF